MQTNPYNDDKRLLELLERWQSGDFSRTDEQELQALTDSDAFRREAVEGFWSLPEANHDAHLASLRTRLRERSGAGRRFMLPQMMAAAAVILMVIAAIWFFPSEQKEATMTEQAVQPRVDSQPIASNFPEEKPLGDVRNAPAPKTDAIVSQTAPPGQTYPTWAESEPAAIDAASEVAAAPTPVLRDDEPEADKAVAAKPVETESAYNKVLDEQSMPDEFQGNSAKRAETKKKSSDMAKAKPKPAGPIRSQPEGGWDKFQDYLRRTARLPEAARQNNVSGSVGLKFRLNVNNQPVDIQIVRSLGYGCDEEAIRLVKAYSWQYVTDQELIVEVPFVR